MSEITHHEVSLSELIKLYAEKLSAGEGTQLILLDSFVDAPNDKVMLKLWLDDTEKVCKEEVEVVSKKLLSDHIKDISERDEKIANQQKQIEEMQGKLDLLGDKNNE